MIQKQLPIGDQTELTTVWVIFDCGEQLSFGLKVGLCGKRFDLVSRSNELDDLEPFGVG